MYAEGGRPSIPPEKLLRALLLQCLYSLRSERSLVGQQGKSLGSDNMKRRDTCAQDQNPARGRAAEGQPNGLDHPWPCRLHDSKVWNKATLAY
jgi:hypothetical protein